MRPCSAALIALLSATPLTAQETSPKVAHDRIGLDSGTVVRFHWINGTEKAMLLAPFGPESSLVRYCRYPAPACGTSDLNPSRARSLSDLSRLEVRQGSQVGRGALIGAGVGALGGLLLILGYSLSDRVAPSTSEQVLTVGLTTAVWSGLGALIGASLDSWEPVSQ
jgi:hypothetical protein